MTLSWTDDQGSPTTSPTTIAATSSDEATVTVTENSDGSGSYAVSSVGPVSTADVTVSWLGTNDDGSTVTVSALVAVVSSEAVGGSVNFGEPIKR